MTGNSPTTQPETGYARAQSRVGIVDIPSSPPVESRQNKRLLPFSTGFPFLLPRSLFTLTSKNRNKFPDYLFSTFVDYAKIVKIGDIGEIRTGNEGKCGPYL